MHILVAGEGLIDFLPLSTDHGGLVFFARPGGSPLNVAVGLSRLGIETGFLGKLSRDAFGDLLVTYLAGNGVDLRFLRRGRGPTALSFVIHDGDEPRFSFYGKDTADAGLTAEEIPKELPPELKAVHLGSLAMVREPCGIALARFMEREHRSRTVSFDPNIRPDQIGDPGDYRRKFSRWLSWIDLLKLSKADLSFIAPGEDEQEVVRHWLSRGPKVVVVTLGSSGARAYTRNAVVQVEAQVMEVVDTVGAGDAFTAGFLAALHYLEKLKKEGLSDLDKATLARALKFATRAAAAVCAKRGADPPYLRELGSP